MAEADLKEEAHLLIDRMPPDATWRDLLEAIYVRVSVERGMEDVRQGRTYTTEQVRKMLGLDE